MVCKYTGQRCGPFQAGFCDCVYDANCQAGSCQYSNVGGSSMCVPKCPISMSDPLITANGCQFVVCTCTAWTNGACDDGDCTPTQRRQYRTCNPTTCSNRTQCVEDPTCIVPTCAASSPSGLSAVRALPAGALLNWTPGAGGTKQMLYVGSGKTEVEGGCPGLSSPACIVKEENLSASQNSYDTGQILSAGETYYFRVVNYESGSCPTPSAILPFLSSCELTPSSTVLTVGDSATLTSSVYSSAEIQRVDFARDSFTVKINPSNDTSYVYSTQVSGESPTGGTPAIVTSDVYFQGGGVPECSDTVAVTVLTPGPWWQVKDGDVQTNGDLNSDVPAGDYFNLPGLGGFPGVAKFGDSTSLTTAKVSENGWLANSLYAPPNNKIQNFTFFRKKVPSDTVLNPVPSMSVDGSMFASGGTESYENFWYEYDASVTGLPLSITSPINLPDGRKVVIFVKGADLNIEGSITYDSGKSILVALVNGNINIDPDVGGSSTDLQGFFLADGNISTGVSANPLHVKGSVVALGGLNLQRNLGSSLNPTTPSEVFEYDIASIFLFPPKLSVEKTRWKEVAP